MRPRPKVDEDAPARLINGNQRDKIVPCRRAVAAPVRYFGSGLGRVPPHAGRIHGRTALAYSPKAYPTVFSRLGEWWCGFVKPLMLS
jgi:hypothetical protein